MAQRWKGGGITDRTGIELVEIGTQDTKDRHRFPNASLPASEGYRTVHPRGPELSRRMRADPHAYIVVSEGPSNNCTTLETSAIQ